MMLPRIFMAIVPSKSKGIIPDWLQKFKNFLKPTYNFSLFVLNWRKICGIFTVDLIVRTRFAIGNHCYFPD